MSCWGLGLDIYFLRPDPILSNPSLSKVSVLLFREKLGAEKTRLIRLGARVIHMPILTAGDIKLRGLARSPAGVYPVFPRGAGVTIGGPKPWFVFTSASGVASFARQWGRGALARDGRLLDVRRGARRCCSHRADARNQELQRLWNQHLSGQ